jgi:hypothetical protein
MAGARLSLVVCERRLCGRRSAGLRIVEARKVPGLTVATWRRILGARGCGARRMRILCLPTVRVLIGRIWRIGRWRGGVSDTQRSDCGVFEVF